jgi:hypothetical protein
MGKLFFNCICTANPKKRNAHNNVRDCSYLHMHPALFQTHDRDGGGDGQAASEGWRHSHGDQVECLKI